MKKLFIAITLLLSTTQTTHKAQAEMPYVFGSGTPAMASEVNENFDYLESRIEAIEESSPAEVLSPHGNITYSYKASSPGDKIDVTGRSYTMVKFPIVEFGTGDVYHIQFPHDDNYSDKSIGTYHQSYNFKSNITISGYPAHINISDFRGTRTSITYPSNAGSSLYEFFVQITISINETYFNFLFRSYKKEIENVIIDIDDYDFTDNFDTSLMVHDTTLLSELDDLIDYIQITKVQ